MQLPLAFMPPADDADRPPRLSPYRRRLAKVAGQAYALGLLRGEARCLNEPPARALGAAVSLSQMEQKMVQMDHAAAVNNVSSTRQLQAHLGREGRNEIAVLAKRIERLVPSHRNPEFFHCEKSEIAASLRRIARRA
jgi:hypothetical protein